MDYSWEVKKSSEDYLILSPRIEKKKRLDYSHFSILLKITNKI